MITVHQRYRQTDIMAIPRYATLRAVKRLYANVQIMLKGGLSGMVTKPGGTCRRGPLSGGEGHMSGGHLSGGKCPISVISVKT